ncbi:MAG: hypothetical protein V3571_11805 [Pseudodesulfovibrio sp.]
MSMNVAPKRPPLARIERFAPPVSVALFLAPLLAAGLVGWLFGPAWGAAVIFFILWGDVVLRMGETAFRGLRKKDKVMAPLVEKTFSCHRPDPVLGWSPAPGLTARNGFLIPRKNLRLDYTATMDAEGRRITSHGPGGDGPTVSFYGCSNTFGWGLGDEETYPWLVQADRPDLRVLNYGVCGYSLYQMLLRMEATIEADRPAVVVLGFSPGLEARSVSDHHYLRILSEQGGTPPSCLSVQGKDGKRVLRRFGLEGYRHLPLSGKSPLVKLTERRLNRLLYGGRAKGDARRKTGEHLLLAMENLCHKHGAVFHVQYLVANTGYREFLHRAGLNWATGPVDLDTCGPDGNYLYRLSPFDGHPNAAANRAYAAALKPLLQTLLAGGTSRPDPGAFGTTSRDEATESAIYPVF